MLGTGSDGGRWRSGCRCARHPLSSILPRQHDRTELRSLEAPHCVLRLLRGRDELWLSRRVQMIPPFKMISWKNEFLAIPIFHACFSPLVCRKHCLPFTLLWSCPSWARCHHTHYNFFSLYTFSYIWMLRMSFGLKQSSRLYRSEASVIKKML